MGSVPIAIPRCSAARVTGADERGVLRAVRDDVEQRVEQEGHVEREVGHDPFLGHRRVAREVVGAEESPLLGGHEQEQDGAPRRRRQRRIGARDLEHDRDARGVVVRAVVDVVAVHRDAAPEVIHVGDVDDVLVLERRVAPLEACDEVGALDVLVGRARDERHAGREVERLRRALRGGREDLRGRLRRTGKERLHAGMVEGRRSAQRRIAAVGVPLGVDPGVAALLPGGDAHVPAEARIVRRGEADRPDRAAL